MLDGERFLVTMSYNLLKMHQSRFAFLSLFSDEFDRPINSVVVRFSADVKMLARDIAVVSRRRIPQLFN